MIIKTILLPVKSSNQDLLGISALNNRNRLIVTETAEKADVHNQPFQSVFTAKEPPSLSILCKMTLQDATECGMMTF